MPCSEMKSYLNGLPGQGGASWRCECTNAHGACAVFWRDDSNGFVLEDSVQIPLLNTSSFLVQAVKLGTANGDRHMGVASVHTDPANPFPGHARDHAYNQMRMAWGDIHYIVARDFNDVGVPGSNDLHRVNLLSPRALTIVAIIQDRLITSLCTRCMRVALFLATNASSCKPRLHILIIKGSA